MLKPTAIFLLFFLTACCPFEHDDDEICEFTAVFDKKQEF